MSEYAIKKLAHSDTYFADGTFYASPKSFSKLYTIHGVHNEKSFPAVYTIMQKRDESVYKEIIHKLKEQATKYYVTLSPKVIKN